MALGFTITFSAQASFTFTDNSIAADYSGLGTVAKTDLEINYPLISTSTLLTLDIVDEYAAAVTNDYTYLVGTSYTPTPTTLASLTDGVYKFRLVVLDSSPAELGSVTSYFVQDYSIKECIKTQVEAALADKPKNWCEISRLNAILDSAHYAASQGNWENAQQMINYLTNECAKLNCSC